MPIYDYVCESCGERVEVVHGIHSPGPERCDQCGKGPMRKLLAPPAIHFKGTGWAKKERAASLAKTRSDGSDGEKAASAPEGGGGDAGDGKTSGNGASKDKPAAASSGSSGSATKAASEG